MHGSPALKSQNQGAALEQDNRRGLLPGTCGLLRSTYRASFLSAGGTSSRDRWPSSSMCAFRQDAFLAQNCFLSRSSGWSLQAGAGQGSRAPWTSTRQRSEGKLWDVQSSSWSG